RGAFGADLIELDSVDAARYAANSFQIISEGRCSLILPSGLSSGTLAQIRDRGVEPISVDVSEFLAKGGGSIKCMILDLGPSSQPPPEPRRFGHAAIIPACSSRVSDLCLRHLHFCSGRPDRVTIDRSCAWRASWTRPASRPIPGSLPCCSSTPKRRSLEKSATAPGPNTYSPRRR